LFFTAYVRVHDVVSENKHAASFHDRSVLLILVHENAKPRSYIVAVLLRHVKFVSSLSAVAFCTSMKLRCLQQIAAS
jgi:hypothetical protein